MFRNDYCDVADKRILQAIEKYSDEQNVGYGEDYHSKNAEELIKKTFGVADGKVYFLCGGTQANMAVISYLLRPYEAVICCDTGHINVHETGAVEGSGHKILTAKNVDGKLTAESVEEIMKLHTDDHVVKPKMVYISNSTETGTIYTEKELLSLRKVCDEYALYLFLDGARLAVALTCKENDLTPEIIGKTCDVFYAGGTKNGLMFGEAVVFKDGNLSKDFRKHIKNRGAMTAKGFILGIEFERLFTDNLYFELAKNSNETAEIIRNKLKGKVSFCGNSPTNQIFIALSNENAEKVVNKYGCEVWEKRSSDTVIRIVTSFKTTKTDAEEIAEYVYGL